MSGGVLWEVAVVVEGGGCRRELGYLTFSRACRNRMMQMIRNNKHIKKQPICLSDTLVGIVFIFVAVLNCNKRKFCIKLQFIFPSYSNKKLVMKYFKTILIFFFTMLLPHTV